MTYAKKQTLAELRNHHTQILSFVDALDNKLNGLTQAGVVILSVFAVVGAVGDLNTAYWVLLGLFAVLYMIGAITAMSAQTPRSYAFPLEADWEVLAADYFRLDESDMRDVLISQYLEAIDRINSVLDYKAKCVSVGTIALSVAMTVLVVVLMLMKL